MALNLTSSSNKEVLDSYVDDINSIIKKLNSNKKIFIIERIDNSAYSICIEDTMSGKNEIVFDFNFMKYDEICDTLEKIVVFINKL